MEMKRTKLNNLEKNRSKGPTLPLMKAYYEVTVIKTAWNFHQDRQIDQ